jgi:hypothetical protein
MMARNDATAHISAVNQSGTRRHGPEDSQKVARREAGSSARTISCDVPRLRGGFEREEHLHLQEGEDK